MEPNVQLSGHTNLAIVLQNLGSMSPKEGIAPIYCVQATRLYDSRANRTKLMEVLEEVDKEAPKKPAEPFSQICGFNAVELSKLRSFLDDNNLKNLDHLFSAYQASLL